MNPVSLGTLGELSLVFFSAIISVIKRNLGSSGGKGVNRLELRQEQLYLASRHFQSQSDYLEEKTHASDICKQ